MVGVFSEMTVDAISRQGTWYYLASKGAKPPKYKEQQE